MLFSAIMYHEAVVYVSEREGVVLSAWHVTRFEGLLCQLQQATGSLNHGVVQVYYQTRAVILRHMCLQNAVYHILQSVTFRGCQTEHRKMSL